MSMKCPKCPSTDLQVTIRKEVEIDYCPNCNGIWLDNGELNKLIARSSKKVQNSPPRKIHTSEKIGKSKKIKTAKSILGSFLDLIDTDFDDDFDDD